MCLVEYESIEESLLVMGFLQGMMLNSGKKLKISFTKSKIKGRGLKFSGEPDFKSIN